MASIASCLLLGFGLYFLDAAYAAAIVFVAGMFCLLIAGLYYIRETTMALSSVHSEERDLNFMDLRTLPEIRARDAM